MRANFSDWALRPMTNAAKGPHPPSCPALSFFCPYRTPDVRPSGARRALSTCQMTDAGASVISAHLFGYHRAMIEFAAACWTGCARAIQPSTTGSASCARPIEASRPPTLIRSRSLSGSLARPSQGPAPSRQPSGAPFRGSRGPLGVRAGSRRFRLSWVPA